MPRTKKTAQSEKVEAVASPPETPGAIANPAYRYSSEFYKASGIPYCKHCGASNPVGMNGEVVCPVLSFNCPRL